MLDLINSSMEKDESYVNRCVICGVDMGDCNPRQLCMKTYCPDQFKPEPIVIDLTKDEVIDLTLSDEDVDVDEYGR